MTDIDGSRASALAAQVADAAKGYEGKVFVRFGPQMNVSWVRWGQRPETYRDAFRVLGAAMDRELGNPVMVWSPTAAKDYPFRAASTTAPSGGALGALDTDGNGEWNFDDDPYAPYAPYYPGDDVVDWVGLSAYHDELVTGRPATRFQHQVSSRRCSDPRFRPGHPRPRTSTLPMLRAGTSR